MGAIRDLPEQLNDIATKLLSYGFGLRKDVGDVWILTYPPGDTSGLTEVAFFEPELGTGLLRVLRAEEGKLDVLHRYEQFDRQWGSIVYGNTPGDTTIAAAGCGPTSLAIVLQYLMNNGSRPRDACYAVAPPETAGYAATHGRVSGRGTAGDPMIRGIKQRWPEFDGARVTLEEATGLLEEGRLIIFLCHACSGYNRSQPLHREPNVFYNGHYMVLAGVEGARGPYQLFYVVDPGRNARNAMRAIKRRELQAHTGGFWWVYRRGEPSERVSRMPDDAPALGAP
jgi:hypothetical protein